MNKNGDTGAPAQSELTTQQAAEMLNVSEQYLGELLQSGRIPFRTVGTQRRVCPGDLVAFGRKDDSERKAAMDELAAEAQKHGLGY